MVTMEGLQGLVGSGIKLHCVEGEWGPGAVVEAGGGRFKVEHFKHLGFNECPRAILPDIIESASRSVASVASGLAEGEQAAELVFARPLRSFAKGGQAVLSIGDSWEGVSGPVTFAFLVGVPLESGD